VGVGVEDVVASGQPRLRVKIGDLRHRIRKVANDPLLNAMLEDERRRV
jgi:hypothetical protein